MTSLFKAPFPGEGELFLPVVLRSKFGTML